jgi:hypothetical protein
MDGNSVGGDALYAGGVWWARESQVGASIREKEHCARSLPGGRAAAAATRSHPTGGGGGEAR